MKEIYLAKRKGVAIVDDCYYAWLNSYKWHRNGTHNHAYTSEPGCKKKTARKSVV